MNTVKKAYEEAQIMPIFNAPAQPELNAIETCFCQVKLKYKQERTNALINKVEFDMDEAIDRAFEVVTP